MSSEPAQNRIIVTPGKQLLLSDVKDPSCMTKDPPANAPSPPHMNKLKTFSLFRLLPAELRIKIWIFAHPAPRNVQISTGKYQRKPSYRQPPLCLHSNPHPPSDHLYGAHLLVNHEARTVFLSKYRRIFVGFPEQRERGCGGGWYFCYEKDSLCMASGLRGLKYFLKRFPDDVKHVQYLDIEPNGTCFHADKPISFVGCKVRIEDLRSLKLVTIRMTPGPTRRIYLESRWAYPPYYEGCMKALMPALMKVEGARLAIYGDMRSGNWFEGIELGPKTMIKSLVFRRGGGV